MKCLLAAVAFMFSSAAFSETCTLQTYASSWMATGTSISVKCDSAVYSGHIVSTPAKRFFRRGHLVLVFDQPVAIQPKNPEDEGKIQTGRGRQIINIALAGGSSIAAKDVMDEASGAIFKSWYMIPIAGVAIAFFSNGGDVNLKPGYKLEVVPLRH
jgi:hypothetical protein